MQSKPEEIKTCAYQLCQRRFITKVPRKQYCCLECKAKAAQARLRARAKLNTSAA